jgi:Transcriptional regulator
MDSEQLMYFVEAARCLNFTDVAKKNYVTQPSISRHINDLERQLGVSLFLRNGHKVQLTSEGELFLCLAQDILTNIQNASLEVQRLHAGKTGRLSICTLGGSNYILKKCLSEFAKLYPDIVIDISVTAGAEHAGNIKSGKFDFFFTDAGMLQEDDESDFTISGHDRLCLALPISHPMPEAAENLTLLADEPFSIINHISAPELHKAIMDICARRNYSPKIMSSYNRAESVLLSVGAGTAVAILPDALIQFFNTNNDVQSIPIPGDDCLLPLLIGWKKNMPNSAAKKFLEIVLELYPKEK